jgi:uncharacterized membrane protein YdjX (TVP38/TMEM64 family)
MHNDEKTESAKRMQHFFAHAHSRAVLHFLVIGLLMLIAIVGIGREIDHHINAIESWIAKLGLWGVLAFIGLFVFATSFLLPDTVLCIIAGALFGFWWGVAAVITGSLFAGSLQFALAHQLLREPIQRALSARPSLAAIQRAVSRDQFRLQMLLRMAPLNPAIISYLLGAAGIQFSGFLIGCLALTPNLAIEVYFGHAGKHVIRMTTGSARTAHMHDIAIIGGFMVCVVVIVLISRIARNAVMQAVVETETPESNNDIKQ